MKAKGKTLVYLQNGKVFEPIEVTLGKTFGDLIEVKSGLFEGDLVVTQRAPQLHAQSLRGGTQAKEAHSQELETNSLPLPWWLLGTAAAGAIAMISFWAGRRSRKNVVPMLNESSYVTADSPNSSLGQIRPERYQLDAESRTPPRQSN